MAALPKSPKSVTNKAEKAVELIGAIDKAAEASIAAPSSVRELLSLYRVIVHAGGVFAAMAAEGFTAEVLGPKIAETIGLPLPWSEYEAAYTDMKNTHLPAFAGWVKTNEDVILATASLDAEGFVTYDALPENLQTEAAPLLANIAASYG